MGRAILLTGLPGSGKTTAIMRVLSRLRLRAGGFYTEEIREGGRRTGFRLVTLDGRHGVMAHVRIGGRKRVGHYGVDLAVIENLGVASIRESIDNKDLVVIDEIGPMELMCKSFREAVLEALESPLVVLGSIVRRSVPFADEIKRRQDVQVLEILRGERENVVERIVALLLEVG